MTALWIHQALLGVPQSSLQGEPQGPAAALPEYTRMANAPVEDSQRECTAGGA